MHEETQGWSEALVTRKIVAAKAVMLCDILLTGTHIPTECSRTLHQTQKVCPKHFFCGIKSVKDGPVMFFDDRAIRSCACV